MRRRLLAEQSGLTVVEGVVACFLLLLGSLAALQLFDTATRASFMAEERQAMNNRLQAELEEVLQLPYAQVAMSAAPAGSADENDPRSRVEGSSFAIARDGTQLAPFAIDATTGTISPAPEPFQVGDVSGEIFKFVVWRDDPNCSETLCPGSEDLKRVIVAAKVTEAPVSFERAYQEIHGEVGDPDATPVNNPNNPGNDEQPTTAEFWLTDTPCGEPWIREPIVEDPADSGGHPVHNTRDECETSGAPDLLFHEAVPLDETLPPDAQPRYDYSNDISPQGEGLLMPHPSSDGCLLEGGTADLPLLDFPATLAETDPRTKVHKWVAPPLPVNFELVLLGEGTLELWTRTVGGAAHPGKICVWLYVRKMVDGVLTDVAVDSTVTTSKYFEFSSNPWPSEWTAVDVPLSFVSPPTLVTGEQIGLAITVERAGTQPGTGLEFMYDHPSFESRVQLDVDRVLPW